ncbi:MAG: tetratricopeptide repeat protein [Methylotenera sp.]|nr:tetratricopeptide repeat protein [Oligoflexia bacterium]
MPRLLFAACVALVTIQFVSLAHAEPPPPPEPTYSEAQHLMKDKKWSEAAIVLKQVLSHSTDSSFLAMELAKALLYSGRREEALSVLKQAASRAKGRERASLIQRSKVMSRLFLTNSTFQGYQEGLNFLAAKKYKAARERFEKSLELEPDNIEIITRIGQCLLLEGDYDSSAERLRLAKKLDADQAEVRMWLGRALHHRGEKQAAIDELKVANEELKNSEVAPIWLADTYYSLGKKDLAIQMLEKDLEEHPFHVHGLVVLAEFKLNAAKDTQALWNVRKDLQVAQSRMPQYESVELPRFESDLGVELRSPEEMTGEIKKLLQRVEDRLDVQPSTPAKE